jgi:hypothetical protein
VESPGLSSMTSSRPDSAPAPAPPGPPGPPPVSKSAALAKFSGGKGPLNFGLRRSETAPVVCVTFQSKLQISDTRVVWWKQIRRKEERSTNPLDEPSNPLDSDEPVAGAQLAMTSALKGASLWVSNLWV